MTVNGTYQIDLRARSVAAFDTFNLQSNLPSDASSTFCLIALNEFFVKRRTSLLSQRRSNIRCRWFTGTIYALGLSALDFVGGASDSRGGVLGVVCFTPLSGFGSGNRGEWR